MSPSPNINLRIPPEMLAEARILAEKDGRSLSWVIKMALGQYIRRRANKARPVGVKQK
jgi:predicted transcriptional regulator